MVMSDATQVERSWARTQDWLPCFDRFLRAQRHDLALAERVRGLANALLATAETGPFPVARGSTFGRR